MKTFLTAGWTNLLVATYEAEKKLLQRFLPRNTELDFWNGSSLISIVGFMFTNVSICGLRAPIFKKFPEINLRIYTRCKIGTVWKAGVVFVREISPFFLVGLGARILYKENFITKPIRHEHQMNSDFIDSCYSWKGLREWSHMRARSGVQRQLPFANSIEAFIANRYLACTNRSNQTTLCFQIEHAPWQIFPVMSFDHKIDAKSFKVEGIEEIFNHEPVSTFLMDGSETNVSKPFVLH